MLSDVGKQLCLAVLKCSSALFSYTVIVRVRLREVEGVCPNLRCGRGPYSSRIRAREVGLAVRELVALGPDGNHERWHEDPCERRSNSSGVWGAQWKSARIMDELRIMDGGEVSHA